VPKIATGESLLLLSAEDVPDHRHGWVGSRAMPSYEASALTPAGAEAVWAAWTDVARWSTYDHIESARIDGEFRAGAVIMTKARGFPGSSLTVTRVERPTLWADESRLPGMRMIFDHEIEAAPGGTRLTERVRISGPLGHLFGPLVRRRLEALLATSVATVAHDAEAAAAPPAP
jgi:Polyketide cyclase / dehydrase and lipid transport